MTQSTKILGNAFAKSGRSRGLSGREVVVRALLLSVAVVYIAAFPAEGQTENRVKPTVITSERSQATRTKPEAIHYLRPKYKCNVESDAVSARVFAEYGSVLAAKGVVLPDRCIYEREADVAALHDRLAAASVTIRGTLIELQKPALLALLAAQTEASAIGRRITPLDGKIAGKRTLADTVRLWNSRFEPALTYWNRRKRITDDEVAAVRNEPLRDQVRRILEWEKNGIFFSTGFKRSIFSSVAPPGTSQHLFMLAFDLVEYRDREVVTILNNHGWYQTVIGDEPHFTFLGLPANELPARGLRLEYRGATAFWVPNIAAVPQRER